MTLFLDVRLNPVGGELAKTVSSYSYSEGRYETYSIERLRAAVSGRQVVIATHGFNVSRQDGYESLTAWGNLLQLEPMTVFIGLLWPGDSSWAHGLDYGVEPKVADQTGDLVGPFLDDLLVDSAGVSFCSHSLGARVVLQTAFRMLRKPRRIVIMAGAIDDDCLQTEFAEVAGKTGKVSLLSSKKDPVLALAFPLGNLLGGIIDRGHPWWRGALGRGGPAAPRPENLDGPYAIPDEWDFVHSSYLQKSPVPAQILKIPQNLPPHFDPKPLKGADGWQQAFSSAFVSTRLI